jgi:hypothetical protein
LEQRLQGVQTQDVLDFLSFQLSCGKEGAVSSFHYNAAMLIINVVRAASLKHGNRRLLIGRGYVLCGALHLHDVLDEFPPSLP